VLEALGATIGLHRTKYDDATWDITFPNGHTWLALKYNGLLFGFVKLDAQENDEASVTEAEELEATMKRGDVPAHVWAARLVTGVDGLQATQKAVLNMKMSSLTPRAMRVIEMDQHRRGSVAKRVPTNAKRDITTRTFIPGKVFVLDAATYPAKDVVKQIPDRRGAAPPTCMMHAWDDSPSDFGYGMNMSKHTVDEWLIFMTMIVVEEKAIGHTVDTFKLDRGPELDCDELKRRVEAELKVKVVIGPSGEHESVHKAEAHMDPCNRATEAMISRARRNLGDNVRRFIALYVV
jgi:hypothetical protein